LKQRLRDEEDEIVNGLRIVPGLETIMIPVQNPDDSVCPICLDEYPKDDPQKPQLARWVSVKKWWNYVRTASTEKEYPVKLSGCGHVYSSACLEEWGHVQDWSPGKPLSISCPARTRVSELNPRTGYQFPWWIRMLRHKWAFRRAILGQLEEEIDW